MPDVPLHLHLRRTSLANSPPARRARCRASGMNESAYRLHKPVFRAHPRLSARDLVALTNTGSTSNHRASVRSDGYLVLDDRCPLDDDTGGIRRPEQRRWSKPKVTDHMVDPEQPPGRASVEIGSGVSVASPGSGSSSSASQKLPIGRCAHRSQIAFASVTWWSTRSHADAEPGGSGNSGGQITASADVCRIGRPPCGLVHPHPECSVGMTSPHRVTQAINPAIRTASAAHRGTIR